VIAATHGAGHVGAEGARRTIAAHLIPKPPEKGSGIRIVK
jgi:hypothetical protein